MLGVSWAIGRTFTLRKVRAMEGSKQRDVLTDTPGRFPGQNHRELLSGRG